MHYKRLFLVICCFALLSVFSFAHAAPSDWQASFTEHGMLYVSIQQDEGGACLRDETGMPYAPRGMAMAALSQSDWLLNAQAFDALCYDWQCDIIRISVDSAIYAADEKMLDKLEEAIALITERGMYALISWQGDMPSPLNPLNLSYGIEHGRLQSIRQQNPTYSGPQLFFSYIAATFGAQGNILYEIYDGPNVSIAENSIFVWQSELYPYYEGVINAIRLSDPAGVILLNAADGGRLLDAPIAQPMQGENILYGVTLFAGDAQDDAIFAQMEAAQQAGLALFCTQRTLAQADGITAPTSPAMTTLLPFLRKNK